MTTLRIVTRDGEYVGPRPARPWTRDAQIARVRRLARRNGYRLEVVRDTALLSPMADAEPYPRDYKRTLDGIEALLLSGQYVGRRTSWRTLEARETRVRRLARRKGCRLQVGHGPLGLDNDYRLVAHPIPVALVDRDDPTLDAIEALLIDDARLDDIKALALKRILL